MDPVFLLPLDPIADTDSAEPISLTKGPGPIGIRLVDPAAGSLGRDLAAYQMDIKVW